MALPMAIFIPIPTTKAQRTTLSTTNILPNFNNRICNSVFFPLFFPEELDDEDSAEPEAGPDEVGEGVPFPVNAKDIVPTSVFTPVDTTIPFPLPLATKVLINAILVLSPTTNCDFKIRSVVLLAGSLSPVRTDSIIWRLLASKRRRSAGTKSPSSKMTISPGTRVPAGISTCSPSRITVA